MNKQQPQQLSWYSDQAICWSNKYNWIPGKDFFLFHNIQTTCGAHSVSQPMGTKGSFSEGVGRVHEAEYQLPSSTKTTNEWSSTSTPPIRLHSMHRHNFTSILPLNEINRRHNGKIQIAMGRQEGEFHFFCHPFASICIPI